MEGKCVDRVDIIIPTYKPDRKFLALIDKLAHQSVPINRIIVMNTEQKYFDRLLYGTSFSKEYHNIVVRHLSKREYDHGRTRNQGVKHSDADYFVMMTQDAVPADAYLVERLLEKLHQDNVAVSYARQLADENSCEEERYTRNFNYPPESGMKDKSRLSELGIKTFFCSNVCAAYDRKIFDSLGGFIKHTIFNEDMLYAAKAVEAGYAIAYAAEAQVYHSHEYTNAQQFHRNFDLGVSQADHPEVFEKYPSESEGIRMVKGLMSHLKEKKLKRRIPHVLCQSACKYAGYLLGKNYHRLPRRFVVAMSSNREYWMR